MRIDNINYNYNDIFKYHNSIDTGLLSKQQTSRIYKISHSHSHYEILQLIEGEVSYILNGKYYDLNVGDIIFIKKNEFHMIKVHSDIYARRVLELDRSFFMSERSVFEFLLTSFESGNTSGCEIFPRDLIGNLGIDVIFEQLEEHIKDESDLEISLLIYTAELLLKMKQFIQNNTRVLNYSHINPIVVSATNYIDNNITTRITLQDIAQSIHVSKYHLSRTFSKVMGITLANYILQKKILSAEKLIEQGLSPTKASVAIGYTYSNFFVNYRKILKKTPKHTAKKQNESPLI